MDGLVLVPTGTLHHKATRDAAVERIDMPAFAIGRHCVTVEQFAAFIDAGGYEDPALWSSDGWGWKLDTDAEIPRFWDDEEWAAYLELTHPVVGVSGYEAEAYASWRGLRLPSEKEWERACRGDDARSYPWGDTWDGEACGHRESGLSGTQPVGRFAAWASPFDIEGLVGTVWQWTSDTQGRSWVVRGGAWNNLPWSIGAHGRNGYPPSAQFSNLGFRVAGEADHAVLHLT